MATQGFRPIMVALAALALAFAVTLPSASAQAPAEINVGGLFAVAYTNVRERASHFRLALDMINDKTDGWFDDLLPNTQIKYAVDNSGCSRSVALEGAATQGTPCMAGSTRTPVVATVGATCSGASMSAQDLLKLYKIPMISYSATSPDLSDKTLYPYFGRVVPSDDAQGKGVSTLAKSYGVKRMGVIASDGAYGTGLADKFRAQALQDGIDQPSSAYKLVKNAEEITVDGKKEAKVDMGMICKIRDLHNEGVRHIFAALQTQDAQYFAATVFQSGYLKGEDFMIYSPDSWSNSQAMQILDSDVASWWYKPKTDGKGDLSGYFKSSKGGDIIPLYQSGTSIESVNVASACTKITGTVSGTAVTLANFGSGTAKIGGGETRIEWESGEVWTMLTPPTLQDLEDTVAGALGFIQSTEGDLLQNYIDTVWEPKNTRYNFDTVNQNLANQFFIDNGEEIGWTDGDGDRKTVHPYGPPSFDAAVAVATAIHNVIEAGDDPTDGEKLLAALKLVSFEGLSGQVSFDENLDRVGSRYVITNRRDGDTHNVGLLAGSSLTFSEQVTFSGGKTQAPKDGTCTLNSQITQYCSGRGTCNFGPGTCSCPVGTGGANCEVIMPAPCTTDDFAFTVSKCSTENERMGVYSYANGVNGTQGCCNRANFGDLCPTGLALPAPIKVECDYVKEDSAVGQAFVALAAISIVFQLALFVGVVIYRNNPFIRRSQPTMMGISIIGAMLGIASIFSLVGERDDGVCRTLPALLALGFTLMYASLALKMYRIHALFFNTQMKVVSMGVRQMIFMLSTIVAAELIVLLLFIFLDKLEAGTTHELVKGAMIPYYECVTTASAPLGIVLLFMKILILVYGLVLGFRVRNAPADYQEVKWIVMGVYNTAIAVIVVMPMYFYLDLDRDVSFIMVCCGILYAFNGATALVVIPKLMKVLKGAQAEDASSLASAMVYGKTAGTVHTGAGAVHTTQGNTNEEAVHYQNLLKEKDKQIAQNNLDLAAKNEEIANLKKQLEDKKEE